MIKDSLNCPVDGVSINENKVRIVALFVLSLTVVFLFTHYLAILVFLLYDFLVRALNSGKYSLLALLADGVIRIFRIKNKPTDRAPKQFAVVTGTIFIALILIAALFSWWVLMIGLADVLILFAFLESFVGFCAGCYVYTILQKLKLTTS